MLPRKLFTLKSWQFWLNKKDLARMLKIVSVISIALLAGSGQIASAATCTSSSFLDPKIVAASLTSTISADVGSAAGDGCTAMAVGNPVQSGSVNVFGQIWNLIQKDVLDTDVGPFGAFTITDTSSAAGESKSGNWSIDTSMTGAYSLFLIVLKPDNGHAYYNVGTETSGTYSDLSHALSHANLYGRVSSVPLPAATWLYGTALIGFIGFSRRTNKV